MNLMQQSHQNVGLSKTLSDLRNNLLHLEKEIEAVRESIRSAESELLPQDDQSSASREDVLVARIVDGVFSRLATTPKDPNNERKQHLREKEAAHYMGVSVSALRSWRTKRSNNGPSYTRLGRMVSYSVSEIDEHMRTRMVQRTLGALRLMETLTKANSRPKSPTPSASA